MMHSGGKNQYTSRFFGRTDVASTKFLQWFMQSDTIAEALECVSKFIDAPRDVYTIYALCKATRHWVPGASTKAAWALNKVVGQMIDKNTMSPTERRRVIRMLLQYRRRNKVASTRQLMRVALCRMGCRHGFRNFTSDFLLANSLQKMAMLSGLNKCESRAANRALCLVAKSGTDLCHRISAATYLVLKGCECGRFELQNALRSGLGNSIDHSRLLFGATCAGDAEAGAKLQEIARGGREEVVVRLLYRLIRRYNKATLRGWESLKICRSRIEERFPMWIEEEAEREREISEMAKQEAMA